MRALINLGDSTPGPDFAALAPAINELAEAGDPVARSVLAQAAADLVEFVLLVRAKLRRKHAIDRRGSRGVDRRRHRARCAWSAKPSLPACRPPRRRCQWQQEPVVSLEGARVAG